MSRIISRSNIQWTGIPAIYLGTVGSYGGTSGGGFNSTSYPTSNSLTNSSSSTYSQFTPASGGEGSSRWGFDIEIPDNATINSITCQIKVACSNGSGFSTARAQFFCGDTAKGTALDFTNNTSTTVRSYTNCGSWTREELDSLELRITAKKSGNSNRYVNFYGADLTITYSYDETQYEVTASSQSQAITVSPASQYITEGEDATVTFNNVSDITETFVTDNNINITGNLVNTSGTTYTYKIENINADHTIIVLNVPSVYVTIINNSSNVSSTSPASGTVIKTGQGSSVGIKIYTDDINAVDIFDNNVKNNSATLMYNVENGSDTFIPSSYSGSTFNTTASLSNGYRGTSNTSSRATLQAASTEQEIYYNFDTSSIPQDATILSISCSVRICVSNSYTSAGICLYSGTTPKSTANTSWRSVTTSTVYNLANIQEFTREELSNVRLRIYGRTSRSGRSIYFYGADLDVTYEYLGDVYYWYTSTPATTDKTILLKDPSSIYIKQNNVFVKATKIYKKISNTWQEVNIEDLNTQSIYIAK
jgi:hypothetical protein